MDGTSPLVWFGAALAIGAVGVLRFAWELPQRSAGLNGVGWALLLAATVVGSAAHGAWGVAVVSLLAMGAAIAALAVAGIRSPRGRAAASNRRVGMLPETGEPKRVGRRFGTFALVILGGLVVSIGFALAIRGLGGAFGWNESNTLVVALFAVPIGWAIVLTVILMQASRRKQLTTLALCSVPGLAALATGGWA